MSRRMSGPPNQCSDGAFREPFTRLPCGAAGVMRTPRFWFAAAHAAKCPINTRARTATRIIGPT